MLRKVVGERSSASEPWFGPMLMRRAMMSMAVRSGSMLPARPFATAAPIGTRVAHASEALRSAQAVCFDVDSTVITSEGIDDLAAFLGCGEKVAELT